MNASLPFCEPVSQLPNRRRPEVDAPRSEGRSAALTKAMRGSSGGSGQMRETFEVDCGRGPDKQDVRSVPTASSTTPKRRPGARRREAKGARTFQSAARLDRRPIPPISHKFELSSIAADWKVRAPVTEAAAEGWGEDELRFMVIAWKG